jgi:hypothetical protein
MIPVLSTIHLGNNLDQLKRKVFLGVVPACKAGTQVDKDVFRNAPVRAWMPAIHTGMTVGSRRVLRLLIAPVCLLRDVLSDDFSSNNSRLKFDRAKQSHFAYHLTTLLNIQSGNGFTALAKLL